MLSKNKSKRKIQMLNLFLSQSVAARGLISSTEQSQQYFFWKNAGYCKYNRSAEELENKTHQYFIL